MLSLRGFLFRLTNFDIDVFDFSLSVLVLLAKLFAHIVSTTLSLLVTETVFILSFFGIVDVSKFFSLSLDIPNTHAQNQKKGR